MKRKLVKQGAATLMISLPSKWTKQFNLKKGDEIDIEEKGKNIVIGTQPSKEIKKAKINISEFKHVWRRVISALYKAGYDEIQINFEKSDEITKVYSVLQEFIGFEIISQSQDGCVIKEIAETKETDFQTIFNRTFSILLSIAEDCAGALKSRNASLLGTIPERDLIVNKYANFCRRIINKGMVEQNESPMLYFIIEGLETMGDVYKGFAKHLFETKSIPNNKIIKSFEEINQSLADFRSLSVKFEKQKIVKFTEKWEELKKNVDELAKTKSVPEAKTISYISEMLQLLDSLVGPLLILNSGNL